MSAAQRLDGMAHTAPMAATRAGIVVGAQLADLAAFLLALRVWGIAGEANPVVGLLYGAGGVGAIVACKVGAALVVAALVPRLGRWWLLPAVVGLAGAATGVLAVL